MPSRRLSKQEDERPGTPASCVLCGVMILDTDLATSSERAMDVLQEDNLKAHRKKGATRGHFLVPSAELANANFSKFPWLASCYYRAGESRLVEPCFLKLSDHLVVQSPSSKWCLTGIASPPYDSCAPFIAPRSKDTARICGTKRVAQYNNALFTRFYQADVVLHKQPRRYRDKNIGYMFHSHCWEVLGHLLGHEVIEKKLDKVVRAVRQYWYKRCPRHMKLPRDGTLGILDVNLFSRAHEDGEVAYAKYQAYAFGCDIHISPWVVPEVQNIINLARAQRTDWKSSHFNKLPLEICLLVLEDICPLDFTQCDVQCTRNMLSVFALDVPESFWRSRLQTNRDLFFEVDCVRDHDSLDWQYLWLGLMDLLADHTWFVSSGLATRKRALRSIKPIVSHFRNLR